MSDGHDSPALLREPDLSAVADSVVAGGLAHFAEVALKVWPRVREGLQRRRVPFLAVTITDSTDAPDHVVLFAAARPDPTATVSRVPPPAELADLARTWLRLRRPGEVEAGGKDRTNGANHDRD